MNGTAYRRAAWFIATAFVLFYCWRMAGIGLDARSDFWTYWQYNRFYGDITNGLQYGQLVIHNAQELESQDNPRGPRPTDATIARPGPGLFDDPLTISNFIQRWQRLRPVYGHITRGWVNTYETIQQQNPGGNYDLDYPPMRLMVMALWAWRVGEHFPMVNYVPERPMRTIDAVTGRRATATDDIALPVINLNTAAVGISAIEMLLLVWIWVERAPPGSEKTWRQRWGDPWLLAPAALLVFCNFASPYVDWHFNLQNISQFRLIDKHLTTITFWFFWTLRFLSAAALARFLPRPIRGAACGLVAATIVWMNPATFLDGQGWPQWDCWILPFLLGAALLATLDWWLAAGIALGIGCMFKGQTLLVAPLLMLAPLLAGWFARFLKIIAGMAAAAGVIVWPWLVNNDTAQHFVVTLICTAGIVVLISFMRRTLRRSAADVETSLRFRMHPGKQFWLMHAALWTGIACILLGVALPAFQGTATISPDWKSYAMALAVGILIIPWILPRRLIAAWLVLVLAASIWLAGFGLDGKFSWYEVGFRYGTQKFPEMQISNRSLSNFCSVLMEYWRWRIHDPVGELRLPFVHDPIAFDLRQTLGTVYFVALTLCAISAASHLRRRDPRFLIALGAPCVLFPVLLTQMSARYMVVPAVMTAGLVGVSAGLSLLPMLLTVAACLMISLKLLRDSSPDIAPITFSMFDPTYPDLGWAMLLLAAIMLYLAVAPARRRATLGLSAHS